MVEPPATMAYYLLQSDDGRLRMLAAAKKSGEAAATLIPCAPSKPLKVMAITPLHMLRFTAFRDGHIELQLPEQKQLSCVYLGQPKDDGGFAHASLDWAVPERGACRTKVSFEWHAQRGEQTLVARTDPPLRYDTLAKSQEVGIPEHFHMARKLLVCVQTLSLIHI